MKTISNIIISILFLALLPLTNCSSGTVVELKDKKGRVYAKKTVKETEDGKQIPISAELDKDRDGKMDSLISYDELGKLTSIAVDKDQNDNAEYVVTYRPEADKLTRNKVEVNNEDGSQKATTYYDETGKKIVMVEIFKDDMVRRAYYKDGKLTRIDKPVAK